MKIALICTEKLPVPPVAGGAVQLYIDGVMPYLSVRHDITVYCIRYPGLPDEETKDDIRFIRVQGGSEAIYTKSLISALDSSYDLVHIFNRPKLLLALAEALPDTKFSLSLHNEMLHPEKIPYEDAVKCVERAEFINTVSQFIADGVKNRLPMAENKLRVVYSGADPDKYAPSWSPEGIQNKALLKEKHGLQNYRVILSVGRLSIKKGVHILLHAMKKVMVSEPETALVIVGSKWYGKNEMDDYTNSLHKLSQALPGPVVFTGFVPPSEIPLYYNIGDIFVCASQWNEPLARVHYEAMAAGLPIITTNRGGNAEIIDNYGNGIVLNEYNNPDAMAESISFLLSNPAKAYIMGRKGRALNEEKFNWSRVAKEILDGDYT